MLIIIIYKLLIIIIYKVLRTEIKTIVANILIKLPNRLVVKTRNVWNVRALLIYKQVTLNYLRDWGKFHCATKSMASCSLYLSFKLINSYYKYEEYKLVQFKTNTILSLT